MTYFIAFESLLWLLFIITLIDARKRFKPQQMLTFFLPLFVYGWALEAAAIHLFQRYSYGEDFLITLFGAPLCIAAGWTSILYSGFSIGQKLSDKPLTIALFTGLWGLSIDLSMDAIAVKLGFWTWVAPEGVVLPFFDVPVSNFIGWFIILSCFSYFHLAWQESKLRNWLQGFEVLLPSLAALLTAIFIMLTSEYELIFTQLTWWHMALLMILPHSLALLAVLTKLTNVTKLTNLTKLTQPAQLNGISRINDPDLRIPLLISHSFHGFFFIIALLIWLQENDGRFLIIAIAVLIPHALIHLKAKVKATYLHASS